MFFIINKLHLSECLQDIKSWIPIREDGSEKQSGIFLASFPLKVNWKLKYYTILLICHFSELLFPCNKSRLSFAIENILNTGHIPLKTRKTVSSYNIFCSRQLKSPYDFVATGTSITSSKTNFECNMTAAKGTRTRVTQDRGILYLFRLNNFSFWLTRKSYSSARWI